MDGPEMLAKLVRFVGDLVISFIFLQLYARMAVLMGPAVNLMSATAIRDGLARFAACAPTDGPHLQPAVLRV
jgi:hypothetical protein